jgi:hypothetical protein
MQYAMRRTSLALVLSAALLVGAWSALADCGPFVDVAFFCSPILELYNLGVASGTSPSTFAPDQLATRAEASAFVARSFNQTLRRSTRRAALGQWWTTTPHWDIGLGTTFLPTATTGVVFDGADLWSLDGNGSVYRVRAGDGRPLETWAGSSTALALSAAMGRVFVTGFTGVTIPYNGFLDVIDPSQPAGTPTRVAENVGAVPVAIAFDGAKLWIADSGIGAFQSGGIVIVSPTSAPPWDVGEVFVPCGGAARCYPSDVIFDGQNVWSVVGQLLQKLDSSGSVIQSVSLPSAGGHPAFDGTNIWLPQGNNTVAIIRASTGTVVATLSGNGLDAPRRSVFDGERMLVLGAHSLTLWRAADLAPLGSRSLGSLTPSDVTSDGIQFWVTLSTGQLARF